MVLVFRVLQTELNDVTSQRFVDVYPGGFAYEVSAHFITVMTLAFSFILLE